MNFFEFREKLNEVYKPEVLAKMKKSYRGKHPHRIKAVSSNGKGKVVVATNSRDRS